MNAHVDGTLHEVGVEQRFYLKSKVAQNHRQSEVLERAGTRVHLVPFSFGVINFREHDVEGALCNVGILLVAGGNAQLTECHSGESVGEDVVRLHKRLSLASE